MKAQSCFVESTKNCNSEPLSLKVYIYALEGDIYLRFTKRVSSVSTLKQPAENVSLKWKYKQVKAGMRHS